MGLKQVLMMYSEWLDEQGLVKGGTESDQRTHGDLAAEFLNGVSGTVVTTDGTPA